MLGGGILFFPSIQIPPVILKMKTNGDKSCFIEAVCIGLGNVNLFPVLLSIRLLLLDALKVQGLIWSSR